MFSDVLQQVKTSDDVDVLLQDIDVLVDSKYRLKDEGKLNPKTTKVLREYKGSLDVLRKGLRSLPVVRLTLAFEPDEKTVNMVIDWCRREVDTQAVVKMDVDEAIVGGAKVSFGGRYGDFTLRNKLAKVDFVGYESV